MNERSVQFPSWFLFQYFDFPDSEEKSLYKIKLQSHIFNDIEIWFSLYFNILISHFVSVFSYKNQLVATLLLFISAITFLWYIIHTFFIEITCFKCDEWLSKKRNSYLFLDNTVQQCFQVCYQTSYTFFSYYFNPIWWKGK